MDKIRIIDLQVYAYHGVLPEEKKRGQKFLVCAELDVSRPSAASDTIEATVNYAEVCREITRIMQSTAYNLIETAAEKLCAALLQKYPPRPNSSGISAAEIEVKKPDAPVGLPIGYVSVVCKREWRTAYIGLGSNVGNREKNLSSAVDAINARSDCFITACSTFTEYKPYLNIDQPDFLNGAAKICTLLPPRGLLSALNEIENKLGRVRTQRFGPRTVDLDILFYENAVVNEQDLIIPHPDLHNRLFVLEPLCALNPALLHPVIKQSVSVLLRLLTENNR
ncbi:MAG: 2-amino-4-hydroxy-6-hydroxymethyldihydropteridine diphosphokinase [Firmicutes bacterium]|nr:2-amino-4-hydroxy-6-hydroxymethyldihydropteridine diphosphokinase [Bacillota bacterium]